MNAENLPPALPPSQPVRLERYEQPPLPPRPFWLHPASAGLILAVDWLFFGAEIITLEVALVFACFSAFLITTVGVFWIQRSKSNDSLGAAVISRVDGDHLEARGDDPAQRLRVEHALGRETVDQHDRDASPADRHPHPVAVGQRNLVPG